MKPDKSCPTCGCPLSRTTEHIARCAKASSSERQFFLDRGRWPEEAPPTRSHRDPFRLNDAQEDWLRSAIQAGDAGLRVNSYNGGARRGLIERGLLEIRNNRVYATTDAVAFSEARKLKKEMRS